MRLRQMKSRIDLRILYIMGCSMQKIIRNAIRCDLCGDVIESRYRHDFVRCCCGNCFTDGGHDYLRRGWVKENSFTDLSETVEVDDVPAEFHSILEDE